MRLVTNEYDDVGNLTAVIDAENHRTEQIYNKRNLLEVTTFADATTQSRTYDGVGNLATLTNEDNEVTTTTYDKENRLKTTTFAGETTENFYDAAGNLERVQKPKGNDRSTEYDGLNRLTAVTDGGLLTTRYEYDANGNVRRQYDPLGNHVEFTYDELGRRKEHIQHKAGGNLAVRYDEYDAEGNLKQMTDAKGQVFRYEYDELNRPTRTVYPAVATPFLTIQEVATTYDANNNVETITESKQSDGGRTITDRTENGWDNFDRLETSSQRGLTITYGYDDNGNRTSVATASGSTTYTFDARNRLQTAVVGSDTTAYTYTPEGLTDTVSYPNGTSTKYTWWPTNRIETITHKAGETVISSYGYQYDSNGNRTQQIEVQGGSTETTDYIYDNLDRLESFTVTAGADVTVTAYTFDGYNRKTELVTENGATTVDRTYSNDETNWLTQVVDTAPATAATITYTYDVNGNTITKSDSRTPGEDLTFDYDAANRMVQTKKGATLLGRYDYNAEGMRVRHRHSERGDIDYFYDDGAVLEERLATGSLLAHYRYADRLLSLDTGGEVQYYHHDGLGSTVSLTDPVGAVKVRYTLDPWGHIRNQIGESVNRQIFTGQEHDEQTGLIYFGARYYDPDSARFISQDSYLGEPGTPPSLHRYLYAYSNPTVYVDPNGNAPVIGDIANILEGLSKDNKDELARMNRGMQEKGAWGQLATRTTAAFMGIGGTIIDAAAAATNLVDLSADAQIAAMPLLRDTEVGQESRRRVEETVRTSVLTAKKAYEYVTTEDPSAMAQAAKENLGNYLERTFIEGDLNYTADFSGKAFGVALGGASVRAAQMSRAASVTDAAEELASKALKLPATDAKGS